MKKLLLSIAFFTFLLTGCTRDNSSDSNLGVEDGVHALTISTNSTRISLGTKDGDTYPVYWSEGDKIVVNGILSQEGIIKSDNRAEATFELNGSPKFPYNITYPYTPSTTAEAPKVVIPTVQQYTEGTFAAESVPMCGYTTGSSKIALKHLCGLLRFPVISGSEGISLEKIVITSTDGVKLSGEFEVNCNAATMVASEDSYNNITYTLPDNFTLSTSEESVFYISVPAIETGKCQVEFIEKSGEKMTRYWSSKEIKAGVVREFNTITYKRGVGGALLPLGVDSDSFTMYYPTISGYVKDTNGNPIEGVAVSDGFKVVATDSKGYYSMDVTKDCWYIYISVPAEYEIPTNEYGQPCFYKPYPSNTNQYNFTLTPLAGGKEKKFALFTFADPQVSNATALGRFQNEAIPGIKSHCDEVEAQGINCYGITLGDIISNGDSKNSGAYRDDMRDGFSVSSVGMPVFQVMGNHDNTYCNSNLPLFPDERSSTFELKAQREHEAVFGPVNFSFNRGDVHIIGMRDIVYRYNTTSGSYTRGFLPSQYEWLKQDLALVPKDKMVVLCVHIQLFNYSSTYYTQEVLSLLDEYKEAHIMSGHIHRQQLYEHETISDSTHKIFEHNTCALCGSWWSANIAGDGTPNGYNVFIGEGNTFSDWYYMGYNTGMNTRSHQMRLYRGNAVTGGPISGTNTYGIKGYYAFNFAENVLLANVYNADSRWVIQVYEDEKYSGDMTLLPNTAPSFSTLVGDNSIENPRRAADGVVTGADFYVAGLHLGILGRWNSSNNTPSNGAYNSCWHMYQYTLKNKDAKIKVVAIDRFNNEYTETIITEGTDYTLTKKP